MPWLAGFPLAPTARTAAAGEVLLTRGTEPCEVLYLRSGRVTAGLLVRGSLRHRLLAFDQPGWLDAASVLLAQASTCDWVVDSKAELWSFDAARLRAWQAEQPQAVGVLLRDMALAQQRQSQAMLGLLMQDAEARCAQWLLQHAKRAEDGHVGIELHLRKRTIAAQLGMAPETLSRVLRALRERGLVLPQGARLLLPDPDGLHQIATA